MQRKAIRDQAFQFRFFSPSSHNPQANQMSLRIVCGMSFLKSGIPGSFHTEHYLERKRCTDFKPCAIPASSLLPMCKAGSPCGLRDHLAKFGRSERLLSRLGFHRLVHDRMGKMARAFRQRHNSMVAATKQTSFAISFEVSEGVPSCQRCHGVSDC